MADYHLQVKVVPLLIVFRLGILLGCGFFCIVFLLGGCMCVSFFWERRVIFSYFPIQKLGQYIYVHLYILAFHFLFHLMHNASNYFFFSTTYAIQKGTCCILLFYNQSQHRLISLSTLNTSLSTGQLAFFENPRVKKTSGGTKKS